MFFYIYILINKSTPSDSVIPSVRVLPQVYFEVRACSNCTACLNGDWEHVAPPPLTHAICPGPSHSVRLTHSNMLWGSMKRTDVSSKYSHGRVPPLILEPYHLRFQLLLI